MPGSEASACGLQGARREFLRVLWTVESRPKAAGGYKAIGALLQGLFFHRRRGINAATLYTAITDGRVTRLAHFGVVIDPETGRLVRKPKR